MMMDCAACGSREIWVLDCDLSVPCPSGIGDGCHYHYECGRCQNHEIHVYDDDPRAKGQSAVEVLDRFRKTAS